MDDIELTPFPVERLSEFSTRVFVHFGVPDADARLAAFVLATSDLCGIESHGVALLRTGSPARPGACVMIRSGVAS